MRVPVPVLRAAALKRAPVRVFAFGKAYALFRDATGRAAAVDDRCPHRFAPLSAGRVRADGRLACPYHGWNFDGSGAGRSPSQPSLKGCDVAAHEIVEACGYLWLAPKGAHVDAARVPVREELVAGAPGAALRALADDPARFGVRGARVTALSGACVTIGDDAIHFVPEREGWTRVVVFSRRAPSLFARALPARRAPMALPPDLAAKLDALAHADGKVRLRVAQDDAKDTRANGATWSGFRAFVVLDAYDDGDGTRSFHLAPKDGAALPPFAPGQHLTFRLDVPGRDKPVVRCYSLSDSHRATHYRVSVKRAELGVASRFFHDAIREGSELAVKAPAGRFALDVAARTPVVLLAGGVGVTPLLAMLSAIVEADPRDVWLYYGVRRTAEIVQRELLARVAARPNVRVRLFVSGEAPPDGAFAGRIDLATVKREAPRDADFYVCGPTAMMQEATAALESWGVADERVHFEAFGPASVRRASRRAGANGDRAPQVTFAKTGVTLPWDSSAATLLAFARDNGIEIDAGCCLGSCSTCTTKLVRGDVARVSEPGDVVAAGACLPCISVPTTDVTLDA